MMTQEIPEWKQSILSAMRNRVDAAVQSSLTIPAQAGGWWHHYVCPEHELPLIFDLSTPDIHRCPRGCTYKGETFDAAFRVFAHRHYAALARDAALLFQMTSEACYLDTSFEILSRYAELYADFGANEESEAWMLSGKAFQQALTEAIWAIPLVQAFDMIRSHIDDQQAIVLTEHLLRPISVVLTTAHQKLVFEQGRLESNYTAWLIAAIGCLGFVLGDDKCIQRALSGAGGFSAHLNAAVLPDGFEYEGSPYYHNFVTLAYTLLAETARGYGIDLYSVHGLRGQSIQQMWSVLADLMWPEGSIPLLHDGNYWQNSSFDEELVEVYEIALARTGDSRYGWLLNGVYHRRSLQRDSWAALAFAKHELSTFHRPPIQSSLIKDVGLGVLRDAANPEGFTALFRFGAHGSGHTHRDSLGLLLSPFCHDAGNPPYGMESRRSWYQQSAAHNLVIVDGMSQAPEDGRLISWIAEPEQTVVEGAADQAYPGVNYSRRVSLEAGQIHDQSSLSSTEEHTFDWLLHLDVPLTCEDLELSPAQGNLFSEGPGSFIQLEAEGVCAESLQVTFEQSKQKYGLKLSSSTPMNILLARSPQRGGMNMGKRYTLIARVHNSQVKFDAVYENM